jgi:hypothetical protein
MKSAVSKHAGILLLCAHLPIVASATSLEMVQLYRQYTSLSPAGARATGVRIVNLDLRARTLTISSDVLLRLSPSVRIYTTTRNELGIEALRIGMDILFLASIPTTANDRPMVTEILVLSGV